MEIYLCYEEGYDGVILVKIFGSYMRAFNWIQDHSTGYYRWFEVRVVE